MYLFLGEADDALGRNVRQALEKRGAQVRVLSNPFSQRFSWRLDSTHTSSAVIFEDGTYLADSDILGVFLCRSKIPGTNGTSSDDHSYIQAEIQAATLGWIWSLQCPVINRLPAWLWYNRNPSIQFWSGLLRTNELQGIDVGRPRSAAGATNETCSEPSTIYGRACVVGHLVIWDRARPVNVGRYETALIGFARCAGISFLEVVMAETSDGIRVKEVDPFPDLSRFCSSSGHAIAKALAKLFTDSNRHLVHNDSDLR